MTETITIQKGDILAISHKDGEKITNTTYAIVTRFNLGAGQATLKLVPTEYIRENNTVEIPVIQPIVRNMAQLLSQRQVVDGVDIFEIPEIVPKEIVSILRGQ